MSVKHLEDIHNFKQEGDESLYQAWERYNDLLYKCPTHDINSHQKVVTVGHEGPSSPKKLKNLHEISFLSDSQEENTNDLRRNLIQDILRFTAPSNNEILSLGRKNGSRFRKMIMEEMEEILENDGEDSGDEM
ncbi:hypothetical protein Tco_0405766 [Tanacetum coccineum]